MTATFHPASNFQRRVGTTSPVRRHAGGEPRVARHHLDAPMPNYAVRRTLAAAIALVVLAAAAIAVAETAGALVDLGGRPAAASEVSTTGAGDSLVRSIHVAAAGDSLWSIADLYRGPVGRDRYVDALISLNGGTDVLVGQAIRLP